jgi:hypothetical protein
MSFSYPPSGVGLTVFTGSEFLISLLQGLYWVTTVPGHLRQGDDGMLLLTFKSSNASWTVGPADWVEFRGADMFFHNGTEPVARFQGGWVLDRYRYPYVECRAMLSIQFEEQAGRIGPVIGLRTAFYLRGVYAFAGRERIAKLDPLAGTWHQTNTQNHWPRMRVMPAPDV